MTFKIAKVWPVPTIGTMRWMIASVLPSLWVSGFFWVHSRAIALPQSEMDQGQQLYEMGQFSTALSWLKNELAQHQQNGDRLSEALTLSNLALVYSELGQWDEANQAIAQSQSILRPQLEPESQHLLAQVLNTQGQLQLQQGQAETALGTWQQAERLFNTVEDGKGQLESQMNQAHALQTLGFYRRSLLVLRDAIQEINANTESLEKAISLRSLGVAFGKAGDLAQAEKSLQQSLDIAQRIEDGEAIAHSFIALGNLETTQKNHPAALLHYQQASTQLALPSTQLNANLNVLRSHLDLKQWDQADQLWPSLMEQIASSPPTSNTVQAQLNLAQSLEQLRAGTAPASLPPLTIAQLLSEAQRDANRLGDRRLESYALGKLGHLYEQTKQYPEAQKLTQQALNLVDPQIAGEVAYQWQWQLGRIANHQGNRTEAIASYQSAVHLLRDLRQDLVSSNPDFQFNFKERVEPLYREYVSLILSGTEPSAQNLEKARQAMESLQLAELDDFFRAACIDVTPVVVDQVDPAAAVIYPIVLKDKLAVVVRLPGKPLKLYLSKVNQAQLELVVDRLQLSLKQQNSQSYIQVSQRLYDWLLGPAIADIKASQVNTLVFVPDGVLRNIPMSVLHDGDRFLIENYAIALTPGLQLFQAGVDSRARSQVLVAGISKAQEPLPPLPHVEKEVNEITQKLRSQTFLNENFTPKNLEQAIEGRSFPIIHIATHGQFSSDVQGTFLHAWGEKMSIDQLREMLRDSELRHRNSLELLVLSACQTAVSDRRAMLGLAGIAARSGAKSTLASLWMVSDESTARLMQEFYDALGDSTLTKAEALQQAQKSVLKETHPYFWSAFVLVGNWQ